MTEEIKKDDVKVGDQSADKQNQDKSTINVEDRLAKLEKEREDFRKAHKKERTRRKELEEKISKGNTTPEIDLSNVVTKDDLFFRDNKISNDEDQKFVKAYAESIGSTLEEVVNKSEVKTILETRQKERISASVSANLQNNNAEGIDIDFLDTDQFIQGFENGSIEQTPENIRKFARLTRES